MGLGCHGGISGRKCVVKCQVLGFAAIEPVHISVEVGGVEVLLPSIFFMK